MKANVRTYTKRHQEKRNAYENAYWQEHKEQKKAKVHRRKARQRNLPDDFTGADWQYCLDYWEHRCAVCGRAEGDGFVLAPDHWIAVMDKRPDNPGTVPTNIVPLCHSDKGSRGGCNNSKHNRDAVTWLVERYDRAEADVIIARVEGYFADLRVKSAQA